MKFDQVIDKKYREAVDEALSAIIEHGTAEQKKIIGHIVASEMEIRVRPVSEINASGVTGVIDPGETDDRIADERMNIREALGEIFIAIAEETIVTGGQRGCEGTLVHEGRHAYDFAQTIASFSHADTNPLSIFDPTLFELEWAAHKISGEYMLCIGRDEYLLEGLQLMILGREHETAPCFVDDLGITRRLRESYNLERGQNEGPTASQLLGLHLP